MQKTLFRIVNIVQNMLDSFEISIKKINTFINQFMIPEHLKLAGFFSPTYPYHCKLGLASFSSSSVWMKDQEMLLGLLNPCITPIHALLF